jgi:hypothetical protein
MFLSRVNHSSRRKYGSMNKMHGSIGWDVLGSTPSLTAMDSAWRIGKTWMVWIEVRAS